VDGLKTFLLLHFFSLLPFSPLCIGSPSTMIHDDFGSVRHFPLWSEVSFCGEASTSLFPLRSGDWRQSNPEFSPAPPLSPPHLSGSSEVSRTRRLPLRRERYGTSPTVTVTRCCCPDADTWQKSFPPRDIHKSQKLGFGSVATLRNRASDDRGFPFPLFSTLLTQFLCFMGSNTF